MRKWWGNQSGVDKATGALSVGKGVSNGRWGGRIILAQSTAYGLQEGGGGLTYSSAGSSVNRSKKVKWLLFRLRDHQNWLETTQLPSDGAS